VRCFHVLDDVSSLLANASFPRFVTTYMPDLAELQVQPKAILGYSGLGLDQLRQLSAMPALKRLSVCISSLDCKGNTSRLVDALRDFRRLNSLVLSWSREGASYDKSSVSAEIRLMKWLWKALGAENANINLQLCYKLYPSAFSVVHQAPFSVHPRAFLTRPIHRNQ
jgi:hypothetical protein